jgi:carboxyl-terminal processing protease
VLPLLRREFERRKPPRAFDAFVADWASSLKAAASTFVKGGIRKAANDTIWWGDVDDDIGYINIYLLTNFTANATWSNRDQQLAVVDDALEEILAAFRDKRAILLDLTHNQGGFDAASDLIASRFADQARHVLTVRAFGMPSSKAEAITVQPSDRTRFTKPVFVMTSEVTVSAGEGLVAMLRAFPHVTHLGQRTRGYLSGILNKPLPASLAVSVTSQIMMIEGRVRVAVTGSGPSSGSPTALTAVPLRTALRYTWPLPATAIGAGNTGCTDSIGGRSRE